MTMTALEKLLMKYSSPPPTVQLLFDGTAVAELSRVPRGKYFFKYLPAFKEKGLASLPGLADLDKVYVSDELFPFFEERIPDMRRPEIRDWMRRHDLEEENKLAVLGALSRKAVTDSFELRFHPAA
jgi:HipA-like protein